MIYQVYHLWCFVNVFLCFSVGGTGQHAWPVMLLFSAATLISAAQCSLSLVLLKSSVCCGAGYI